METSRCNICCMGRKSLWHILINKHNLLTRGSSPHKTTSKKMKKVFLPAFIAAAFAFGMVACNNNTATEETVDTTPAAPVECVEHQHECVCDSTCATANCANCADSACAKKECCKKEGAGCVKDGAECKKECAKEGEGCKNHEGCKGHEGCKSHEGCKHAE